MRAIKQSNCNQFYSFKNQVTQTDLLCQSLQTLTERARFGRRTPAFNRTFGQLTNDKRGNDKTEISRDPGSISLLVAALVSEETSCIFISIKHFGLSHNNQFFVWDIWYLPQPSNGLLHQMEPINGLWLKCLGRNFD